MRQNSRHLALVVALLVALVASACAGASDAAQDAEPSQVGDETPIDDPAPVAAESVGDSAESDLDRESTDSEPDSLPGDELVLAADVEPFMLDLLRWVPLDAVAHGPVILVDNAAAARSFGLELPACSDSTEDIVAALLELGERDVGGAILPLIWSGDVLRDPDDSGRTLGIELCDVYGFVDWLEVTGRTELLRVETAPENTQAIVSADPLWSQQLETRSVEGLDYWYWGDGLELELEKSSPARPTGAAGTLGFVEEGVVLRAYDDAAHRAVAAIPSAANGLLDDPTALQLVTELASGDPYRIQIERVAAPDAATTTAQERTPPSDSQPLLVSFDWIGFSTTYDGEIATTVVLGHDTEALALENAARLPTIVADVAPLGDPGGRWSDRLTIESVRTDGPLAIFTFRLAGGDDSMPVSARVDRAIFQGDTLFWTEPISP